MLRFALLSAALLLCAAPTALAQSAGVQYDGQTVAVLPPAPTAAAVPLAHGNGGSGRHAATTVIDFEFFPGPDGVLGTGDDIPIIAPTLFSAQLDQLTDEFATLGINFVPDPSVNDTNEVLDAATFSTPPSHTPPNLLASAGSAIIGFEFSVTVTSVTALIGISGGSDEMEIFDASGASLGSMIGDDVEVTLSSATPIKSVVIRPINSTTPAIDNLTFETGGGFTVSTRDTCPGRMTFDISGATPNASLAVVRANGLGTATVGAPCGTVTLGLSSAGLTLVTVISADGSGNASLSSNVPGGACGRIHAQIVDLSNCATSNTLSL